MIIGIISGGGGYKKCRSVYLISTAICFME